MAKSISARISSTVLGVGQVGAHGVRKTAFKLKLDEHRRGKACSYSLMNEGWDDSFEMYDMVAWLATCVRSAEISGCGPSSELRPPKLYEAVRSSSKLKLQTKLLSEARAGLTEPTEARERHEARFRKLTKALILRIPNLPIFVQNSSR